MYIERVRRETKGKDETASDNSFRLLLRPTITYSKIKGGLR